MSQSISNELYSYVRDHFIAHMRAAGETSERIESMILNMMMYDPLRAHFMKQYLEGLPEENRQAAVDRLSRLVGSVQEKIVVLTVIGQPALMLHQSHSDHQVAEIVATAYGIRSNGQPHMWRREPLDPDGTQ